MNYNIKNSVCRFSDDNCVYFHRDEDYDAVAINVTGTCLRWVSNSDVNMDSALYCSYRVNPTEYIFVVRGIFVENVIPG